MNLKNLVVIFFAFFIFLSNKCFANSSIEDVSCGYIKAVINNDIKEIENNVDMEQIKQSYKNDLNEFHEQLRFLFEYNDNKFGYSKKKLKNIFVDTIKYYSVRGENDIARVSVVSQFDNGSMDYDTLPLIQNEGWKVDFSTRFLEKHKIKSFKLYDTLDVYNFSINKKYNDSQIARAYESGKLDEATVISYYANHLNEFKMEKLLTLNDLYYYLKYKVIDKQKFSEYLLKYFKKGTLDEYDNAKDIFVFLLKNYLSHAFINLKTPALNESEITSIMKDLYNDKLSYTQDELRAFVVSKAITLDELKNYYNNHIDVKNSIPYSINGYDVLRKNIDPYDIDSLQEVVDLQLNEYNNYLNKGWEDYYENKGY